MFAQYTSRSIFVAAFALGATVTAQAQTPTVPKNPKLPKLNLTIDNP